MALHRLRARLRFPTASGMAGWCQSQMAVRFAQAVHINPGMAHEEAPRNAITPEQPDGQPHQVFTCDLPLMDEAHAIDAFNTLSSGTVMGVSVAFPEMEGPGYVEHHVCAHDETPPQPCEVVSRQEVP